MARFILHAIPLLVLLLALFGFAVELLDFEPRGGSVIRLALLEQPTVPAPVVIGTWLIEVSGLLALFLVAQGRCGLWWLDGLVAGWIAWIFRGPLLVITIVVAVRQPQQAWWSLAFGWWVLYSVCGLSLAILYRWSRRRSEEPPPQLAESTAGVLAAPETTSDVAADAAMDDDAGAGSDDDAYLRVSGDTREAAAEAPADGDPVKVPSESVENPGGAREER